MDEKHSSNFPTEPTSRSPQQSSLRHPSASDGITRIEQSSRMDNHSRVDQSPRLGQQSALKGTVKNETQIRENNSDSTIKENTKEDKPSVKTDSTGKEFRQSQIYRKVPIAKEAKKEEVPILVCSSNKARNSSLS